MALLIILIIVGACAGAGVAYLQAYFAVNDPAAGAWLSGAAFFLGSGLLIAWLLLDPAGILAPSFTVASALSYLLMQIVLARRARPVADTVSDAEERKDVGAA